MHILVLHLLKYNLYAVEKRGCAELAISCNGVYISYWAMMAMSVTTYFLLAAVY
jgi:hypothetical protein